MAIFWRELKAFGGSIMVILCITALIVWVVCHLPTCAFSDWLNAKISGKRRVGGSIH